MLAKMTSKNQLTLPRSVTRPARRCPGVLRRGAARRPDRSDTGAHPARRCRASQAGGAGPGRFGRGRCRGLGAQRAAGARGRRAHARLPDPVPDASPGPEPRGRLPGGVRHQRGRFGLAVRRPGDGKAARALAAGGLRAVAQQGHRRRAASRAGLSQIPTLGGGARGAAGRLPAVRRDRGGARPAARGSRLPRRLRPAVSAPGRGR